MDNQTPVDPARTRFIVLNLLRLSSAFIIAFGVYFLFGNDIPLDASTGKILGIVFIITGVIEMFVVAPALVKKWKTPDDESRLP